MNENYPNYWELRKKFKFSHTNEWYMPNPESTKENETRKISWDFEIQTNHLISAKQPDLEVVNKNKREPAELWTFPFRRITG